MRHRSDEYRKAKRMSVCVRKREEGGGGGGRREIEEHNRYSGK